MSEKKHHVEIGSSDSRERTPARNSGVIRVAAAFAVLAAVVLAGTGCVKRIFAPDETTDSKKQHLVLLQINDFHGAIERAEGIACVVNAVRAECAQRGCDVLFLNAGDIFGNTPQSEISKGRGDIDFLNAAGVDVSIPGNHEIDFGLEAFEQSFRQTVCPDLAANLMSNGKPVLPPYAVLSVSGSLRVGVLGITHGAVRSASQAYQVEDPVVSAKRFMPELEVKSDVQVVLSHVEVSQKMALGDVPGVDVVLNGHNHPESANGYCRLSSSGVPVCESAPDGQAVGRVDIKIDRGKVVHVGNMLIPADGCKDEDLQLQKTLKPYLDTAAEYRTVIGFAKADIPNTQDQNGQSPLGKFIVNFMKNYTGADLAVMNSGGVRGDGLKAGQITKDNIFRLVFDNSVVVIEISGRDLMQRLRAKLESNPPRRLHLAGFSYDVPLDSEKTYRVATTDFLVNQWGIFKGIPVVAQHQSLRKLLIEYVAAKGDSGI